MYAGTTASKIFPCFMCIFWMGVSEKKIFMGIPMLIFTFALDGCPITFIVGWRIIPCLVLKHIEQVIFVFLKKPD